MTGKRGRPLIDRLRERTVIDNQSQCWLWQGGKDSCGYGQIGVAYQTWKTHRLGYTLLIGEIPPGMAIDHLCQTRSCWNPEHLEAVTPSTNARRQLAVNGHPNSKKTHCPRNHPYDEKNTRIEITSAGAQHRYCRTCARERARARYHRNRQTLLV